VSESDEFERLTKRLVAVPKKEIDAEAAKHERKKKSRSAGKRSVGKTPARDGA
jgi:hypothetical protein